MSKKNEKIKVKYSSNNSGGSWWLKDKDWVALEKAGWTVEWGNNYYCHSKFSLNEVPYGKPQLCKDSDKCPGHRRFDTHKEMKAEDRHLDALATTASKSFNTISEAITEFEKITKQDVSDEGCNCCGAPHTFYWGICAVGKCNCPERTPHKDYNYASGEVLLEYMYPDKNVKLTKRELLEAES